MNKTENKNDKPTIGKSSKRKEIAVENEKSTTRPLKFIEAAYVTFTDAHGRTIMMPVEKEKEEEPRKKKQSRNKNPDPDCKTRRILKVRNFIKGLVKKQLGIVNGTVGNIIYDGEINEHSNRVWYKIKPQIDFEAETFEFDQSKIEKIVLEEVPSRGSVAEVKEVETQPTQQIEISNAQEMETTFIF